MDKYYQILSYLTDLENIIFDKWAVEIPDKCQRNLVKPILIKNEDTFDIDLNFDDEVGEGVNICLLYINLAINVFKVGVFSLSYLCITIFYSIL